MTSTMSKRQQARNEKALQDLVQSVPGNNMCADCGARNPSWASWSLGIFLCMRCAAIHRKLGTHISKVKSLSMDGWSNEQVDNMKRVGNVASNRIYNAENKKPPVPVDADEADSAMERFIRSKYMTRNAPVNGTARHRAESTDSEGTPPPLPPKTGSKFFKTASTFPLSFRSKKNTDSQRNARVEPRLQSPSDLRNKPSKIFGASVHQDSSDDSAQKLAQLRDMGFTDDKRNSMILKGVNGSLEKTIEALVRLGEKGTGGGGSAGDSFASREGSLPTSRSLTPAAVSPITMTTSGLSKASPPPSRSSANSNNPWDVPPAQPQSSQSTGTLQNKNPFFSTNPFGMPAQQTEMALNQSLQNLSLSPPAQQSLFPNRTGGMPGSQPMQPAIYQQSMTPPVPQSQSFASSPFNSNQTYPQPFQQQAPAQHSYNPFLQTPAQQQPLHLNTTSNQGNNFGAGNPFTRSPTRIASPTLNQIPEQTQQNFYSSPLSAYGNNPFFAMNPQVTQQPIQQPMQQQPPMQPQQLQQLQQAQYFDQVFTQPQPQPLPQPQLQQQLPPQVQPQQPQWHDKASIMALYNQPSFAPNPQDQSAANPGTGQALTQAAPTPAPAPVSTPQRSVSTPLPGNKNPFMSAATSSPSPAPSPFAVSNNAVQSGSGRSRDSMTLGMEMAWNNGRHSPDAFASLSARGV